MKLLIQFVIVFMAVFLGFSFVFLDFTWAQTAMPIIRIYFLLIVIAILGAWKSVNANI